MNPEPIHARRDTLSVIDGSPTKGAALRRLHDSSGRPLPPIVLGTSRLGSVDPTGLFDRRARRRAFEVLDGAFEAGCRALDLGRSYQAGGTERVVGEWLRHSGARDELFLVSKGGHPWPVVAPNRVTPRALDDDLRATLDALGIDRVDLYLLHRDHPEADLESVASALPGISREGVTRFTGMSNWSYDRLEALRAAGPEQVVHASSPQLSLFAWRAPIWKGCHGLSGRARRYERRRYARAGLPTFAYCPLAQGFVTGASSRWSRGPFDTKENRARRARCERLAKRRGAHPVQVALGYLRGQPFPVFPVVGTSTPAHMRANLEAAALPLDDAERAWLESGGERRWEAIGGES